MVFLSSKNLNEILYLIMYDQNFCGNLWYSGVCWNNTKSGAAIKKRFPNSCCMIVASLLWMWEKYYLFQKTSVNKSTISFHGSTCLSLWSLLKQKTLLFWAGFDNRVKMQSLIGWICFNKSIILSISLIFFSWDHLLVLSKKISLCMARLTKVWAAWLEEVFEAMACTLT